MQSSRPEKPGTDSIFIFVTAFEGESNFLCQGKCATLYTEHTGPAIVLTQPVSELSQSPGGMACILSPALRNMVPFIL